MLCLRLKRKPLPTQEASVQRVADKLDSARFTSPFLASGFFCFQAESSPAHLRLLHTVSPHADSRGSKYE
jgi:hypothetical protein